jgi:hypothetical protein
MDTGNGRKSETAQENKTQRENLSSRNPCRAGRFCAGTRRKAEQQIKSVAKTAATKRKSIQDETCRGETHSTSRQKESWQRNGEQIKDGQIFGADNRSKRRQDQIKQHADQEAIARS